MEGAPAMVRKGPPQLFVIGDQKHATWRAAFAGAFVKAKYLFNSEEDGRGWGQLPWWGVGLAAQLLG